MEGSTADSVNDGFGSGLGSPVLDEVLSEQQSQSGDSVAEWRSSEQVENGTPSTSPPYWDTEDDEDAGPKPSELYGKFTWKIENFSQINKRELKSDTFVIGGHKWYILIYPQGCDVCNHLSLFLCVANHEKLLPGWSHFAQFTIAVVNKDPKKSKYSDTLHRFWKKEHDWGWKKFMELSKVVDGFIVADTLVIKAQVQVIREKIHRPFRCLDCQYRRELVRVYLSNVEQICRRFVEDRKEKLCKLIFDRTRWSSLRLFWSSIDQNARWRMSRDKKDAILKVVVKHFFIEKEVTSTLVMDSLHSGLKAIEWQSESKRGNSECDKEDLLADSLPVIVMENDMFVLADDVLVLVERTALEPLPPKDDKNTQSQNLMQNRTKDGSTSDEFSKDSIDRDERRLTELGCRTLEMFVLAHIFSRVEVAYQEVVALKRQEELIREEEAAFQAENLLKAKRSAAEKEKRSKKKQAKQKRNNRRVKDKCRDEKPDETLGLESQIGSISNDINLEESVEKQDLNLVEKFEVLHVANGTEMLNKSITELQDTDTRPKTWDKDMLGVLPDMEASSSNIQNEEADKNSSLVDDSSSTSSTDSAFLVVTNGTHRTSNNKGTGSPNIRNNRRNKSSSGRSKRAQINIKDETCEAAIDVERLIGAVDSIKATPPETKDTVSLSTNDLHEYLLVEKKEDGSLEVRECTDQVDQEASSMSNIPDELSSSSNPGIEQSSLQSPKQIMDPTVSSGEAESAPLSNTSEPTKKLVASVVNLVQESVASTLEQRMTINAKATFNQASISRPPSAPLIATSRPTATIVSTSQTPPVLSRSASAVSRLGTGSSLPMTDSFVPQSYRNAMMGRNSAASSTASFAPQSALSNSSRGGLYSVPTNPVSTPSSTISFPSRTHPVPASPGFTFGSVNPKALNGGGFWNGDRSLQELRSQNSVSHAPGSSNNTGRINSAELQHNGWYPEFTPKASLWQKQGSGTEEFPHLDIINYLLDEEHSDGKATGGGYSQLTMNRQYTFPGCLASADTRSTSRSYGFEDQYCRDASQLVYNPSLGPLDGREELLLPQMDQLAYAPDNINGVMLNQWPSSIAADSPLVGVSSGESHGYPYHLQNYSNFACGMNGYSMYRHTNGF